MAIPNWPSEEKNSANSVAWMRTESLAAMRRQLVPTRIGRSLVRLEGSL
jgi:hypothetical protein